MIPSNYEKIQDLLNRQTNPTDKKLIEFMLNSYEYAIRSLNPEQQFNIAFMNLDNPSELSDIADHYGFDISVVNESKPYEFTLKPRVYSDAFIWYTHLMKCFVWAQQINDESLEEVLGDIMDDVWWKDLNESERNNTHSRYQKFMDALNHRNPDPLYAPSVESILQKLESNPHYMKYLKSKNYEN